MHRFHVPDMTCGGCLASVTRIIRTLDPQAQIEGDLEVREIAVTSDTAEALLLEALSEAGYPARLAGYSAERAGLSALEASRP